MKKALQSLYKALPFKQELFQVLRAFKPGTGLTRHLKFKGTIVIPVPGLGDIEVHNDGYYLEEKIFWKGFDAFERYSVALWTELSRTSPIIFDIGANTGIYSLVAARANPAARIFAFEPVKRIFAVLERNKTLNKSNNITLLNLAVSNEAGTFDLYDNVSATTFEQASLEKDYASALPYGKEDQVVYSVPVETVKSIIEQHQLPSLDLVKIDIETHEPMAVKGMEEYLLKYNPILIIEILNKTVADKLKPHFDPALFVFYNIDEERGVHQVTALDASSSLNFVICPKVKEPILAEALTRVQQSLKQRSR